MATIDEDDEGKTVVDASGDQIGTVADVRPGTVYVEPNPDVTDKIAAKLGLRESDEDTYQLNIDSISAVTDDEVQLEEER